PLAVSALGTDAAGPPAAGSVAQPPAQQRRERGGGVGPGEYRVAHLVARTADVERERKRVRPVDVAAVPVVRHGNAPRSRTRWCRRRCPWTGGASGTALRGRTPPPPPLARRTRRPPCPAGP